MVRQQRGGGEVEEGETRETRGRARSRDKEENNINNNMDSPRKSRWNIIITYFEETRNFSFFLELLKWFFVAKKKQHGGFFRSFGWQEMDLMLHFVYVFIPKSNKLSEMQTNFGLNFLLELYLISTLQNT